MEIHVKKTHHLKESTIIRLNLYVFSLINNFVKISELRDILKEGFDAIHKRFDRTDEMCKKNTIETDACVSKIAQVTAHAH